MLSRGGSHKVDCGVLETQTLDYFPTLFHHPRREGDRPAKPPVWVDFSNPIDHSGRVMSPVYGSFGVHLRQDFTADDLGTDYKGSYIARLLDVLLDEERTGPNSIGIEPCRLFDR